MLSMAEELLVNWKSLCTKDFLAVEVSCLLAYKPFMLPKKEYTRKKEVQEVWSKSTKAK